MPDPKDTGEKHHIECDCERCKELGEAGSREPDIVQVQKEAWARIAEEERRGERQTPVVKWSAADLYLERIFHGF